MIYSILLHKNGFGGIESYMESLLIELEVRKVKVEVYIHNDINTSNLLSSRSKGGYLKYFLRTWGCKDCVRILNNHIPIFLASIFFRENKIILLHGVPQRNFWFYYLTITLNPGMVFANSLYLSGFYEKRYGKRLGFIYPLLRKKILSQGKVSSLVIGENRMIGYLGRITVDKHIEYYVKLHNDLCDNGSTSTLLLQGIITNEYKDSLLALSSYKELIIFEDFSEDVSMFFSRVDTVLYFANPLESYGITIAESLFFGKKVVINENQGEDFKGFRNVFVFEGKSYIVSELIDFLYKPCSQFDIEFNQILLQKRQLESINIITKND